MRGWNDHQDLPLISYLILGGEHPIVVDTGADVDSAMPLHGIRIEQSESERMESIVASAGIDPADVRIVINTHLHWDHSSKNHLFPHADVIVQRSEVDFAGDPVMWHRRQFEALPGVTAAWRSAEDQIRVVEGDVEVAPGVTVVALPGHTPGSQGVLVEAESKRYLIAGDTVYLYENWEGDQDVPHIPVGLYTDLVAYENSIKRIESFDCEVIPSHDFRVIERGVFS
jgi:glyoxylase-like metal-dependent hydrolase (beta-lactamase superfamily II)